MPLGSLAGVLKHYADVCMATKVAWCVTDNASACKLARELLVSNKGYKHILEMR